ncbi:hypothetical protein E2562_023065 [Oryza meyeriana var. granulata]|uniref:Uncharacterized protein n=1 Tax=Oryza meyeriana var. granulata TaxID=110450 RepID=A0A6G1ENZ4_9ORYZ|nr:hypothetical protein E2562_023065 [Oryza meyeriana var. granulata]
METTSAARAINSRWLEHSMVEKIKIEEGRKMELIKVRHEYVDNLLGRLPCCDLGLFDGIADHIPFTKLRKRICATMVSSRRTRQSYYQTSRSPWPIKETSETAQ